MKSVLLIAVATAAIAVRFAAEQAILPVAAGQVLPRWDLATHLVQGWTDYHLLVTGQIHRLAWDLWQQAYWPPLLSVWQVPFYFLLGGTVSAGLWSSAAAFVLAAGTGAAVLWHERPRTALFAASLFAALLASSPFLLAYAMLTMTEILGAFAQLVVLLAYARYRSDPAPGTARLLAIALTLLFFVKYNYFFLLGVPLVIFEWLERTSGRSAAARVALLAAWLKGLLKSPTAVAIGLYFAALAALVVTGGFELRLAGQRISVRGIGATGHVVLYAALARLWFLHRRGRIDWARLVAAAPLVRPLLVWFVVPVTIWLATPYPNHMRDVFNLVVNRPMGEPTVGAGLDVYAGALVGAYVYAPVVFFAVAAAFLVAAARYRAQPPVIRLLIVAIPIQAVAILLHQTRFPRFLLLSVVLLCLVASSEVAAWFAARRSTRLAAIVLAPVVAAAGIVGAREAVGQERFRALVMEHFTASVALRDALDGLRGALADDDRLLIVGESNELSPALFRWELGRASGRSCDPFPVGGVARLDPERATRLLLLTGEPDGQPVGVGDDDPGRIAAIRAAVDRGDLVLQQAHAVPDRGVTLRLYAWRAPPPAASSSRGPC